MSPRRSASASKPSILESGKESFSIESRIIREFGERLVKQPEVALLELIKNAYDADSNTCTVSCDHPNSIVVSDTGHGMTISEFKGGWMRIGTSSKEASATSRKYKRPVSGEKGIGRFAVRYLGRKLELVSTAYDPKRGFNTTLTATFDWPKFDRNEDLGAVQVPYEVIRADPDTEVGTQLRITDLRPSTENINFRQVQTASLGLLSPYQVLLSRSDDERQQDLPEFPTDERETSDSGFNLVIDDGDKIAPESIAADILQNFVMRCVVSVENGRLKLRLYRRGEAHAAVKIDDKYDNDVGRVYADLRFFPSRKGTFKDMPVDGRQSRAWLKEHSGVAVFDRDFRVLPYGTSGDDWIGLAADTSRNERNPQSTIAIRHFPMTDEVRTSTQLNYMLRLPLPSQLVGAVKVFGIRSSEQLRGEAGLLATADRQGFVDNTAFRQLVDVVRGAAEVIAYADRELQLEEERFKADQEAARARQGTQEAIAQIQASANLTVSEKKSLVKRLLDVDQLQARSDEAKRTRDAALETMSLLGIVAGFMTHEFGTAIHDLERSLGILGRLSKTNPELKDESQAISGHIAALKDFTAYSQGFVRGTSIIPEKPVPARPRIQQVLKIFGKYASDRGIKVTTEVEPDVKAPMVPLSLYSGIVLNLYTNALKAVMAKAGTGHHEITIRAWVEKGVHRLQVSDTGIGIPAAMSERIFDPLFTTTDTKRDLVGSGMGLGLTLVKRGAQAFKGTVEVVKPPPRFSTCFDVKLPMGGNE
jgi:signal transduction histidine kinase